MNQAGRVIWIALLLLSGGMGSWFLGKGIFEARTFYLLDERASATVSSWEVVELSSSDYRLRALYFFEHQGKQYKGATLFQNERFLNAFSAESGLRESKKEPQLVWFHAKDPSRSSLEKHFPLKQLLYGFFSLGVFLFFLIRLSRL